MGADEAGALERALAALGEAGVVPRVARLLDPGIDRLLIATVVVEVAEFSSTGNPEIRPDLERHAAEHVAELQRLLAGGTVGALEFARAHARRCAEQRFPLEAILHAYRCDQKILSHWLREAAIALRRRNQEQVVAAVADFAIEYTNAISTIAAAEYVAHTRALAEAEGDRRTELLNVLLSGYDESDGRVARLLKRSGYLEQRLAFCVALAQSTDPLEMESPARAQRIVAAITRAVAPQSIRVLAGVRNNVVTVVFSDVRRASGWTAPRARLTDRVKGPLAMLGPAVLIGISSDQPSTGFIPKGLHEAAVALDFASVTNRVVQFSELSIRRLLVHRGADYVQPALPAWFDRFKEADTKAQGALGKTLRALADADINVQQAARTLRLHPNTVYARIERIRELTGLDGQRFHDLSEILLAADCARS